MKCCLSSSLSHFPLVMSVMSITAATQRRQHGVAAVGTSSPSTAAHRAKSSWEQHPALRLSRPAATISPVPPALTLLCPGRCPAGRPAPHQDPSATPRQTAPSCTGLSRERPRTHTAPWQMDVLPARAATWHPGTAHPWETLPAGLQQHRHQPPVQGRVPCWGTA